MSISTPRVKPVPSRPRWAPTALLAAVLAVPAPAIAKSDADAVAAGHAQRTPTELGQTTAPREPTTDDLVLRRDGSKAVPFVSVLNPEATPAAGDGFDWGSAAVGAGAAMALISLGGAAFFMVRRHTAMSPTTS